MTLLRLTVLATYVFSWEKLGTSGSVELLETTEEVDASLPEVHISQRELLKTAPFRLLNVNF